MHINFFDGKKIHYFVAASFFFLFSQFSLSAEQSECDEKKRAGDRACATTQTNVYSYERERECRWSVDQEYQSCLATVPPYEEVPPVHPDGTNHLDYAGGMSGMPFAPLDDLVGGGGWGVGANGPPAQLGSPNDTSDCPVVKSTGEKFFEDADYRGIGLNPLFVTRYHRQDPAEGRGLFGSAWTSNLDVTMTLWLKTSDNEAVLCALGANNDKCNQAGLKFYAATIRMPGALGKRTDIRFDEKSGGGVGDAEEVYYLSNLPDSAKPVKFFQLLRQNIGKEEESYVYFDSSAKKWTFDRRGRLTSMSMGVGSPWNIFYGAYNRVDYVEHGGEKTYFYYSPIASKSNYDWVVTSIKLPNSKTIDYAYEAYDFTTAEPNTYSVALLTKVSYPGAVGDKGTIAYHYDWWRPESSTRARKVLTKKFIDGAQWGDYVYYPPETVAPAGQEEEPKVKKSGLVGGVNQTHFEYIPNTENPNVNTTIVTTNAKGGTTTYTYLITTLAKL